MQSGISVKQILPQNEFVPSSHASYVTRFQADCIIRFSVQEMDGSYHRNLQERMPKNQGRYSTKL